MEHRKDCGCQECLRQKRFLEALGIIVDGVGEGRKLSMASLEAIATVLRRGR
jgi:hypothetical protein